jgi:hypothetical protein
MDRATHSAHRPHRIPGIIAVIVGAGLLLVEARVATYVLLGTAIVVAVVWPILYGKRRNPIRTKTHITLVAFVSIGFWICTTTALRFADSSDGEGGGGAASLVSVNPWGAEMSAGDLMIHGVISTVALALLAHGFLPIVRRDWRRARRSAGSSENDLASARGSAHDGERLGSLYRDW